MLGPEMPGTLTLVLPLPPSVNHLYATVQGRRVLSRAGREFKAFVAEEVERWLAAHPVCDVGFLRRHYIALTLTFFFTTALRRDLDGGLKIAQDALCEALGMNDNLVVEIHLSKRVDRHCPRLEVILAALTAEQAHLSTAGDMPRDMPPLPRRSEGRLKRRKRRKLRSLEELAARHRWEFAPMVDD